MSKIKTGFEKLTPMQKKSCGLTGYQGPRIREPNEATGQLINKMAGVYSQADRTFYRNDGHKHLKSLGVLC